MKLKDIPEEQDRVDLDNLPLENELRAISEKMADATEDKTGGLIIEFKQRDEKRLTQKYGKMSAKKLKEALTKLGIEDTEELQQRFLKYKLVSMRSGYPRYIPYAECE